MTTVLVTRPGGISDPLVAELQAIGYTVLAVPTVVTRPLDVAWPRLEAFDWIVVTSAAGVDTITAIPPGPRWAAVGRSTADALRARGAEVAVVPDHSSGAALADAIPDPAGLRVLLVRASLADHDLPDRLRQRGAHIEEVTAYETVEGPAESREPLLRADVDAVVFASGSAIRGFVALGGSNTIPAITIGPRTTAVARDHGFNVVAEAAAAGHRELAVAVERAIPPARAAKEIEVDA